MASMEFDDSGLVVAQLVAVIRQQLFLGPHHEGHPEPAIEGAAMIEGVAAVQNPAVTGIDSYRGVPAGVTGHRHQNDTGADGIEGFGRCESAPGFPVGTVLHQLRAVGPLSASISQSLAERRGVDGTAGFGGGDVEVSLGKSAIPPMWSKSKWVSTMCRTSDVR